MLYLKMQLSLILMLAFIPSLVLASTSLNCNDTYHCICGNGDDEEPFHKFVHCDTENRIVLVDILMCITYENKLDMFVVGNCPFSSRMLSTADGRYVLPNEFSAAISPTNFNTDVMCRPTNRTGCNCGKCNNATAVAINSYFLRCVPREECHWSNWFLVLLADLGPVTVLFIIVVVFHIRFTSGYANTYIFFAQMVSMQINVIQLERDWINVLANTSSADDIVIPLISVYSIWSLDLGRCIAPNLCSNHHFSNYLHPFLLQYVIAIYGLVLIITVYVLVELHARNVRLVVWLWRPFRMCFSRLQRQINAKTSLIDAFATFLLLSYSKFVFTSIIFLEYANLYNRTGNVVRSVLFYDGTVDYFGTRHLPLAVVAIIVVIIFVLLPFAMILYPLKCVQRCLTHCRLHRPALVAFMDAFQGCYKDGTNGTRDLRFFSAVYWFVRVVVFTLYATFAHTDVYPKLQLCLLFMCSCLIVLIATLRPYKRNIYNHFDVAMLAYFVLIVGGCMYHWLIFKRKLSLAFASFSVLFLMIPFLVAVGYVSVQLCMFVRSSTCVQQWVPSINHTRPGYLFGNLGNLSTDSPQSNSFPDRLLRPEEYTEDNMQSRRTRRFYGAL